MGVFYFDESIHPRAGFSLGAYVYSESPLEIAVAEALRRSGFRPGIDEYKSGVRIPDEPAQAEARHKLRGEIRSLFGQIGIVVSPDDDRTLFARDALLGLRKIVANNRLGGTSHTAYFDEGVFVPPGGAKSLAADLGIDVTIFPVRGLQDPWRYSGRRSRGAFTGHDAVRTTWLREQGGQSGRELGV